MNKTIDEISKDSNEILIPKMKYLSQFLGKKDWLVGYLTIADFAFYSVCKIFRLNLGSIFYEIEAAD